MRVVLIHGWNVRDGGANTIDKLAPHFEAAGWEVDKDEADYGFIFWRVFSFVGRRLFSRPLIKKMVPAIAKADLIVTHSNGAAFSVKGLDRLKGVVHEKVLAHVSPALNKKRDIPVAVKAQLVIHTRRDQAVKMAKLLPANPWGNMGSVGYQGLDQRNENEDVTNDVYEHSAHFHGDRAEVTAKLIMDFYARSKP